jgi:signal peptidase I
LASFLIVKKLMGIEKEDFPDKKEIILVLVISILLYYVLTYSTVFFWGILKNRVIFSYNLFLNTIIPLFLIIIITELLRFIIIRKGRGYKSIWILAILFFTLIEIAIKIKGYDFNLGIDVLKFSIEVFAPSLIKNILLCYLVNRVGYKSTITFRILFEVPLYLLPFFPNLGIFIDSILKIIFPTILLFVFLYKYSIPDKYEKIKEKSQSKIPKKIGYCSIIIIFLTVVTLTSAKFNLFTIVIGSGSMKPILNKGDVVLVQKINPDSLNKGDIIIFKHDRRTVIHRLIDIKHLDGESYYYTKGDANKDADDYGINGDDIVGKCAFTIKYLGYPTIWINDKIKQ